MTKLQIAQRIKLLNKYDEFYRAGNPKISDIEFDRLVDELKEDAPDCSYFSEEKLITIKTNIGKGTLPAPMFSMNKAKTLKELFQWIKTNELEQEVLILTPKYDGLSLLADEYEKQYFTRGDGFEGHRITRLFNLTLEPITGKIVTKYFGEGIIKKQTFHSKYTKEILGDDDGYKNARNMVASLFNPETKEPEEKKYKDVIFVRYGCTDDSLTKEEQLKECNVLNRRCQVPFIKLKAWEVVNLDKDYLDNLYNEWCKEFDIDGIIFDVNSVETRTRLGRGTNNNPKYAIAFKGEFETVLTTTIKDITPQTSKDGFLTPVAQIEPVMLDGALVSNVTLYNYRYVKDNKLGVLAKIAIKRSGGVIPKVVGVLEPALHVKIPKILDGVLTEWDENEVELRLIKKTDTWRIQELLHFFRIFKIDEMGEPTVRAFYNAGNISVQKILTLTEDKICLIEGFSHKKAKFLLKEFKDKIACGNHITKIMTSSNLFTGLGEKTLLVIFKGLLVNKKLVDIDGIGPEKTKVYEDNINKFWDWYIKLKDLIPIEENEEELVFESEKFKGERICFTGFRDKELENFFKKNGGEIVDGVSKNTTMLIVKDLESGSSKIKKAQQLGINISEAKQFNFKK